MQDALVFLIGIYAGLSIVAFLAYAVDKWAARKDRWRIPERTLHLLGFVGGWPGALLARRLLWHKTSKRSFVTIFWITVVANLAVVTALVMLYQKLIAA